MDADDIIRMLDLASHPEGGWYRQTWVAEGEGRPVGTCIYFLLRRGKRSHWHRVDATEIWHYYAGAPIFLHISASDEGPATTLTLGPDLASGARPQGIVPKGHWKAAETAGDWTLVGCNVRPGFQFEGFELAALGFDIPKG